MIGERIGSRYRVLEKLPGGNMATVYRALDEKLGKEVALKVLDPSFGGMMNREALIHPKLRHPNIVPVSAVSAPSEEHDFIVMQLVRGRSLRELMRERGPMEPRDAVRVIHQVLAGLSEAHHQGVVHADIKPENIIIADDGAAMILDFGIAVSVLQSVLNDGRPIGTPQYMAPEAISDRRNVNYLCDVYSCGVVLYEMLTAVSPFCAVSDRETTRRVQSGNAAPMSTCRSELNEGLVTAVGRAMSREARARYQSCGEFAQALMQATGVRPDWSHFRQKVKVQRRRYAQRPGRGPASLVLTLAFGGFLLVTALLFFGTGRVVSHTLLGLLASDAILLLFLARSLVRRRRRRSGEARMRPGDAQLRLVCGSGIPARLLVHSGMTIGRDESADLVLSEESVSRHHARIVVDGRAWLVEDIGSTNGVTVNGVRVKREILRYGDRIGIGRFVFEFEASRQVNS